MVPGSTVFSPRHLTVFAFPFAAGGLLLNPGLSPVAYLFGVHQLSGVGAFGLSVGMGLLAVVLALNRLGKQWASIVVIAGSFVLALQVFIFSRVAPDRQEYLLGELVVFAMITVGWALTHEAIHLGKRFLGRDGPGRELADLALMLGWLAVGFAPLAFLPSIGIAEPIPLQVLLIFVLVALALIGLGELRTWGRLR